MEPIKLLKLKGNQKGKDDDEWEEVLDAAK